jgi:[ribosomal protein S18]-alanine N-acetyltransferase
LPIRRAQPADLLAIFELDRESPTAAHWSRQRYESLLAAGQLERLTWIAQDENKNESPSEKAGGKHESIVGFLVARRIGEDWELENIAVSENARRRGFAMLLLNELIACVKSHHGAGIFLEVRESNQSARALYKKTGFAETGRRKGYYNDPAEDAIVCQLRLY